jgi:hypothetical protein
VKTGTENGKFHLRTGHEGPEGEKRYGSTIPLTSALSEEGGWWVINTTPQLLYPQGKKPDI